MKATHSQGPWKIAARFPNDNGRIQVVSPSSAKVICDIWKSDSAEANATLIASAPGMADFIKRVSTFTGYLAYNESMPEDSTADAERFLALLAEGRALYAKATQNTL